MHHSTTLERQQRLQTAALALRLTISAVLLHRRLYRLGEIRLQLDRRDRQTVDEENQINLIGLIQRVTQLRHHPEPIGSIASDNSFVPTVFWQGLAHRQSATASNGKAIAQHVDRAAIDLVVQLLHQTIKHHCLGASTIHVSQLCHRRGLTVFQPVHDVLCK